MAHAFNFPLWKEDLRNENWVKRKTALLSKFALAEELAVLVGLLLQGEIDLYYRD